jgi:hypothetical protein
MALNKFVHLHGVLPAVDFAIKTQKKYDQSWSAGHTSGAMDENFFGRAKALKHEIKSISSLE